MKATSVLSMPSRLWQTLLSVLGVSLALPLAAQAYISSFTRYMADDYIFAARLQEYGFFGSQVWWYQNWSGRFSATFFINLGMALEPRFSGVIPIIVLCSWVVVAVAVGRQAILFLGLPQPTLTGAILGLLVVGCTTLGAPAIGQSLYWLTGAVTFTVPLVLITALIGICLAVIRRKGSAKRQHTFGVFVLALIAGGCSESFAVMQTGLLAGLLMLAWMYLSADTSRAIVRLLGFSLIGSSIALLVVALSPGNAARQDAHVAMGIEIYPPLLVALRVTVESTLKFLSQAIRTVPVPIIGMATALPLLCGTFGRSFAADPDQAIRNAAWALTAIPFIAGGAILSLMVPAAFAMADAPPQRTLIAATFILSLALISWSYAAGLVLASASQPRNILRAVVPALASLVVIFGSVGASIWCAAEALETSSDWKLFAQLWDETDRVLRSHAANGQMNPRFDSIMNPARLSTLHIDPTWWVNTAVSDYYGLESAIGTVLVDE